MTDQLTELLKFQEQKLKELLELLEKQHHLIIKEEAFELESIVEELKIKSQQIAKLELDRRNLIGNIQIKDYIENSDNKDLKESYKKIQQTLNKTIEQKDTNDLLLKQQLLFTNKMLTLLNPDRQIKTYNSYGGLMK